MKTPTMMPIDSITKTPATPRTVNGSGFDNEVDSKQ